MKKFTVLLSILILALIANTLNATITTTVNGEINGASFVQGSFFQVLISGLTPGATTTNQLWIDENGDGIIDPATDFLLVPFRTTDGVSGSNGPGDGDGSVNGNIDIQIGGMYFPVAKYIFKAISGTDSATSTFSVTAMTSFTYTVSGKVTSPGSLKNIAVSVETDTGKSQYIGLTDINGNYSIPINYSSGTAINVEIHLGNNGDFNSTFTGYNSTPRLSSFSITKDTSGVNFVLSKGIIVTGKVTDIYGVPIPNMQVEVEPHDTSGNSYDVSTDSAGIYMDAVPPGIYDVSFSDQNNPDPRGYVRMYYNQMYTYNTCNPITVTSTMDTLKGINGVLSKGGLIEGTISDGGQPDIGGSINVYPYNNTTGNPLYQIYLQSVNTSYKMYVPPGTYSVFFIYGNNAGSNTYGIYYNQSSTSPGTPVTITNIYDTAKNINVNFFANGCSPYVNIGGNTNICSGLTATFTANFGNGGTSPILQWVKNGVNVGSNTYFYSDSLLNNGDSIWCILTSNASCNTGQSNVYSNVMHITVNQDLSGNIIHPSSGLLIPEATAILNDSNAVTVNGNYIYNCLQPNNYYKIKVKKNNDIVKTNGVTTLDIALIQSHILQKNLLNNPYKIIAADVNGDGNVSVLDIVYIKRLVLGIDTTFTNTNTGKNRLWIFVDSSYKFPDNTNPFPHKDSITYSGLNSSKTNQTFIGCKLGDVNWDWNPAVLRPINNTANVIDLSYSSDNIRTSEGYITIPIRVKNFKEMLAIQFTISFNASVLQWLGLGNNPLGIETGINHAGEGNISFLWVDPKNEIKTLEDGSVIFELVFRTIQPISNELLDLNGRITAIAAYDKDENLHGIVMNSSLINNSEITKESWSVVPNPTSDGLIQVQMTLKNNKTLVFRLTDYTGKLLMVKEADGKKGYNSFCLRQQIHLTTGTYYLQAKGVDGEEVKNIIVK